MTPDLLKPLQVLLQHTQSQGPKIIRISLIMIILLYLKKSRGEGGGGTLGISGWGCAPGTLEPLTYTRATSAEFCYPIPE